MEILYEYKIVFKNINKVFWGKCTKKEPLGISMQAGGRIYLGSFFMEKKVENFMPGQPPFGRVWRKNKNGCLSLLTRECKAQGVILILDGYGIRVCKKGCV